MYNLLPLPSSLPSPSSEFNFLLSGAESFHSYCIQPGNCHDRSLSSESITLSSAHLLGLFREFRHYILPCQHDGHSKPASVLLFKVSWWQLDLCNHILGGMQDPGKSAFSKYGCTPQMTGLAPFGRPSLPPFPNLPRTA